ncbi:SpoIIE family protein phosphatase [Streptomyces sp. NPDC020807]|uniref:SpoIIE family protein phosphatase n=1 Tax=Streptomyces sp. NPDC020807 TaxID=3155119 RepID=UPI0033F9A8DE
MEASPDHGRSTTAPTAAAPGADRLLDEALATALLDALLADAPTGLHILDRDLRVVHAPAARPAAPPWRGTGNTRGSGAWLELPEVREALRTVLDSGEPVRDLPCRVAGARKARLSLSALPLRGPDRLPLGVAVTFVDGTARERAEDRVRLLERASSEIGTSLDVFRTAEELAGVAVPGLADAVAIDVLDAVLGGEAPAPGPLVDPLTVRRAGFATASDAGATGAHDIGAVRLMRRATPYADALADLTPRVVNELGVDDPAGWLSRDPDRSELFRRAGVHSLMVVPLTARGAVLGLAAFYRAGASEPFDDGDLEMAVELAARAAVCLDNARLSTRERTLARIAQRSLVPARVPVSRAVETAHSYLPVAAGGTWYDVIPLSGARVALVAGDVRGRGLRAATAMGQLRTAVHAFAAMDLEPAELLTRLHDLTARLATEHPAPGGAAGSEGLAAGCAYLVYDPVRLRCETAAADHPAPVVTPPDRQPHTLDVHQGPALGQGTAAYRTTTADVPEGTLLALYDDGLVPRGHAASLEGHLAGLRDRPLRELCDALTSALLPDGPQDDALLLLARTRSLGPDDTALWTLPDDPRSSARARRLTTARLTEWGMDEELVLTAELIVSELVTNAIRYATGPIDLRLIRGSTLTCEVTDSSSTSPHLRLAADTDEGGRGLYLVGRFADRWGTRHLPRGKTIWTEQQLT